MKSFPVKDTDFTKSSRSKNNTMTSVEVAIKPEGVAVRNPTDKIKKTIFFSRDEWKVFVSAVKDGEFESQCYDSPNHKLLCEFS